MRRARPHGARLLLLTAAAACGAGDRAPQDDVPDRWTVSAPVVEIGVDHGEPHDPLDDVTSAVRLDDGRIVLADGGSAQLRIYGSDGVFLAAAGGRGDGPGEFRRPGRIRITHPDSLLVEDPVMRRSSRFDTAGRFVWTEAWPETDEPFPRSAWLYRGHFVDGPAQVALRGHVRRALDALPSPEPGEWRHVVVDEDWRLWIRPGTSAADTAPDWTVHELDGAVLARVTLPARFRPTQFGRDFVVGVSRDSLDVETVRVLALGGVPPEEPETAAAFADIEEPVAAPAAPAQAVFEELRAALRDAQAAQEIFYSRAEHGFRYADRIDRLALEPGARENVALHIVEAGTRGYTILAFHMRAPAACALTVGLGGPFGWASGRPLCQ